MRSGPVLVVFAWVAPWPSASGTIPIKTGPAFGGQANDRVGPGSSPQVTVAKVNQSLYSNDSPGSKLFFNPVVYPLVRTPEFWTRRDYFTVTAMYNPFPPADPNNAPGGVPTSIWVPVGSLSWGWGVWAKYDDVKKVWTADGFQRPSQIAGTYDARRLFPVWERTKQSVDRPFQNI